MKSVFFVGEINVDIMMGGLASLPVVDREVPCSSFETTVGSSTAICACAYASLGGDTRFMGLAGMDEYGDFMVNGMQSFGIKTDAVKRTNEVRTGVTVNLIFGKTRTQVTYPGTIAAFNRSHLDFQALGRADHIHIGGPYMQTGFLPSVVEVLKFARDRGISTSLDPQWDGSEKWEHLKEWLPLLDYFFPNRDEALSITGEVDLERACLHLAGRTACPVVKAGADGAWAVMEGIPTKIAGYPVEIVDNTGAGDSFDAAFLFCRLEKGFDIKTSMRWAHAVAARSCLFVGGVNARTSWADAEKFLETAGRKG